MRRRTMALVVGMLAAVTGLGAASPALAAPTPTPTAGARPAMIGGIYNELVNPSTRKCMEVKNASTASGAAVQQWDCKQIDAQQWAVADIDNDSGTVVNLHSSLCLDLADVSGANGTRVVQKQCLGQSSARWRVLSGGSYPQRVFELINVRTGKCLDLNNASATNGTVIQTWDCALGTAAQTWVFQVPGKHGQVTGNFELLNQTRKCADVLNESTSSGAVLQGWDCKGIDAQQWAWVPLSNGAVSLINLHSSQCLDLANTTGANGTRVVQHPCAGQTTAQWVPVAYFSWPASNFALQNVATGKCLDVSNGSAANGTAIQIWDCGGEVSAQLWTLI